MAAMTYPDRSSYLQSLQQAEPESITDGQSCFSCTEVFQTHCMAVVICPNGHMCCSDCIHSWTLCGGNAGRKCPFCRHELFAEPMPSESLEESNDDALIIQPEPADQSAPAFSDWGRLTPQQLEEARQRFNRNQEALRQMQRRYLGRQFHETEEMGAQIQVLESMKEERRETHPETFDEDCARLRIACHFLLAQLSHLQQMQTLIDIPEYDSANDEEWDWISKIGDHYCSVLRILLPNVFP